MNILVPLGAGDQSFREIYPYGKNLAEINHKPLIQHVIENLATINNAHFLFVVRKQEVLGNHLEAVLRLLCPDCAVVVSEGDTGGAACTAMLAIEHIVPDQPLIVANGDQILRTDLNAVLAQFASQNLDAGTVVFESVHPRWSYVRLDETGLVVEAAEKKPISRLATAGFYYFRRGEDFLTGSKGMIRKNASVDGRFFVCPVFNELILLNRRIGVVKIAQDEYSSLSTPRDVEEYEKQLTKRGHA